MKKMIAVMAFGALVLGSVAMGMGMAAERDVGVDQAQVDAKIDARLHELLLAARMAQYGR